MPEQILSVPGKIYPGVSEELVNQPMTDYNDLRNVMAVRPDILDATAVLFAEQSGMLSEIVTYLGGNFSPERARNMGGSYAAMEKDIKFVGNHEFAWRMNAPKGFVYRFTRAPQLAAGVSALGEANKEAYVFLNRIPLDQDDVIELADGETQLLAIGAPEFTGSDYKVRVKLLKTFPEQVVDSWLLQPGQEACVKYNIKPEASEHGSKVRTSFGSWAKNYLTTMRFEWNLTGMAAHTKTNVQWLVYTNPKTGKMEPYWMPVLDYEMMAKAQRAIDAFLFNGKKAVNPDGTFMRDIRSRLYYSGDGVYTQCSKKLRVAYEELTENHLETMMKNIKLDSLEVTDKPVFVCLGGLNFRLQFDKLLRNVFRAEPHTFFIAKNGDFGLKSNFKMYEIGPLGTFYVADTNVFDSKYQATAYDQYGERLQSYRGIVVNVSNLIGGRKAITLVSRAGRQNVIGQVNGMANPGQGGQLTTTADVAGKHLLIERGVAVHNPYLLGEFYKPFKQY